MYDYDVLVLGSGPGGQKAAIATAKLGKRAGVVERRDMIGGVCINTGTIPSKTLREAVLYLTGLNQREMYGQSYRVKEDITVADLLSRAHHVIGREVDVIRSQLSRNRVAMLTGAGRFVDEHTIEVMDGNGRKRKVTAEKIVIATGTQPPGRTRSTSTADRHRLGRHPAPAARAAVDDRGRRRGDRHRVRLHVRRAGLQGDRGRAAGPDAGLLRHRGGRGAEVPPARSGGHLPVRRDGRRGRAHPRAPSRSWPAARRSRPRWSCTRRAGRA